MPSPLLSAVLVAADRQVCFMSWTCHRAITCAAYCRTLDPKEPAMRVPRFVGRCLRLIRSVPMFWTALALALNHTVQATPLY